MTQCEIYDEVAYCYDGSFNGLLCTVFASYQRNEIPTNVASREFLQPRLMQRVSYIETSEDLANRVERGIENACGKRMLNAICRAYLSTDSSSPFAIYRFIRHAMDEHRLRSCVHCNASSKCDGATNKGLYCPSLKEHALNDIAHPEVMPFFKVLRGVDNECEHIRQFARFEHIESERGALWLAQCEPRDKVVPLVMGHFARRFGSEKFALVDKANHIAGLYDGSHWRLVDTGRAELIEPSLLQTTQEEATMQQAWRAFYQAVSVESRYNPELRVKLMPKRFWGNLTELKQETDSPRCQKALNAHGPKTVRSAGT